MKKLKDTQMKYIYRIMALLLFCLGILFSSYWVIPALTWVPGICILAFAIRIILHFLNQDFSMKIRGYIWAEIIILISSSMILTILTIKESSNNEIWVVVLQVFGVFSLILWTIFILILRRNSQPQK